MGDCRNADMLTPNARGLFGKIALKQGRAGMAGQLGALLN